MIAEVEPTAVRCPSCGALVPVEPDWRLVQCPKCHEPVVRMTSEPNYD